MGPLVQEIWQNRCSVDSGSKIASFQALVDALETCRLGMPDQGAWFQSAWKVKERQHLETLVSDMDIFFAEHDLTDLWTSVSQGTLMVWIAWLAILKEHTSKKAKVPEICTESRTLLKGPEAKYILSDRLNTYAEPPYFQRDSMCMKGIASDNYNPSSAGAREGLPELSPPRMCELRGTGFVTWSDLNKHVEGKHGNWAEYRKRVFWHAQFDTQNPCYGLPLSWKRKRRMIANATTRLVSSAKLCKEEAEEERPTPPERVCRKMIGCAVCATKLWEERMRRCYMFRKLGVGEEASKQEEVEEERAQSDASEEDQVSRVRGRQRLLSDKKASCILAQPTSYRNFWPWRSTKRDGRVSLQRSCTRAVCSIQCTQSSGGYYTVAECQFWQKPAVANPEAIFHVVQAWAIRTGRCYFARGAHAVCATGSPRCPHALWRTIRGAAGSIHCINDCGPYQPQKCY